MFLLHLFNVYTKYIIKTDFLIFTVVKGEMLELRSSKFIVIK